MRALLVAASVVAVAVLVVVGSSGTSEGDPGPTLVAGTPKTLDQIPLVQSFHIYLPRLSAQAPFRVTLPSTSGFVITELSSAHKESGGHLTVKINGVRILRKYVGGSGSGESKAADRESPILVWPGATLELAPEPSAFHDINLSGYILTRADLGLQ